MKIPKSLLFWLLSLALLFLFIFVGPYVYSEPEGFDSVRINQDGSISTAPFPPGDEFILGTDEAGNDMLGILMTAGQGTILLIFAVVLIRYLFAIPLAFLGKNNRGLAHHTILTLNQVFTFVPLLLGLIFFMTIPLVIASEQRILIVIAGIVLFELGRTATVFQGHFNQIDGSTFMEAPKTIGSKRWTVWRHYYWRHIREPLIVHICLDLSKMTLLLGQLGFFSMFISQTFAVADNGQVFAINAFETWPSLLSNARAFIPDEMWVIFWPSLALAVTSLVFFSVGNAIQKMLTLRESSSRNH